MKSQVSTTIRPWSHLNLTGMSPSSTIQLSTARLPSLSRLLAKLNGSSLGGTVARGDGEGITCLVDIAKRIVFCSFIL